VNYIIGALSTLAFSLLFYRADLLASALLNLYLTPQLLYGWIRWNRDEITRPVTNVTWKSVPAYLVVTGLFWFGAYNLVKLFDGQMAGWDTAILIGSILAQFLLDNKKLQTWIVWAVVNVIAIILYAKNGLQITAFQYVFFLLSATWGYRSWSRSTVIQLTTVRMEGNN
jgi:nicotinamide mononucleotide transporter